MIGPDGFAGVSAAAAVPEQVVAYVTAVSGSRPRRIRSCVGYQSGVELVLVGYPIHNPTDEQAMAEAVNEALRIPGLNRITVIGPACPPQVPAGCRYSEDFYSFVPVPPPPPGQKLRNLLRRAGRELTVEKNRLWGEGHAALVGRYLEERAFDPGTVHILRNIPKYLTASSGSLIFSARKSCGRLAAFAVGEFSPLRTAFFMFCFRDPTQAPPGSTDLLVSALFDEAGKRGHTRLNLGLGINDGVRFFKRKWGESMKLPCFQVSWNIASAGFYGRLRALLFKRGREEKNE